MAEQQDLVIQMLRHLQADMAEIRQDVQTLRLELRTLNYQLSAMEGAAARPTAEPVPDGQGIPIVEPWLDLYGEDG